MSQQAITTSAQVMDQVLARHFEAEANHDIPAILDTLTDDVEHDVVGWPGGPNVGHKALTPFYEQRFGDFQATDVKPLHCTATTATIFCVDEVEYHAIATGSPAGAGRTRPSGELSAAPRLRVQERQDVARERVARCREHLPAAGGLKAA